ncbi:MAG TPA: right-handed parallel beta-helix repeat-containing protein [Kofleriaceae bacterium]
MIGRKALLLAIFGLSAVANAATLHVGPNETYTTIGAAAAAVADGDVVEIDAGTYHEAVVWQRDNLTIRGVGARPVIDMTGMAIANGKGIFVSDGANFAIENLEFVGASVSSANGAGLRWEGGGTLAVHDCVFRSNEDGILGGNPGGMHPENTATIENNEFVDNSHGDPGLTHSVYIGEADSVTFRGNWSHALYGGGSDVGHLFKSRAHHNFVLYNRLTSEDTPSSYEVNLPEGGEAYVIGNLIQQRVGSQRVMISFGDGDGTQYAASKLYVANNTFVSESAGDATFVRTTQADAQLVVANNLFVGPGTLTSGGMPTLLSNVTTASPGFVDQAMFDYHLTAGSPAVDAGADPGMIAVMSLSPVQQYVHPRMLESRAPVGAPDVGAYELGNMPDSGDNAAVGDDTPVGPQAGSSGCGCDARSRACDGWSWILVITIGLGRRLHRRRANSRSSAPLQVCGRT